MRAWTKLRFSLLALTVLTLVSCGRVGHLSIARGQDTKVTEFPAGFVESTYYENMVFAPGGRTLALVKPEGVVMLCDLRMGKSEMLPKPFPGRHWSSQVAFSKDGHLLAIGYGTHGIVIWDIDAKKERARIPLRRTEVIDMVFTDRDRTLLALCWTTKLNIIAAHWEVPSGAPGELKISGIISPRWPCHPTAGSPYSDPCLLAMRSST